jgi:hypothetical protein
MKPSNFQTNLPSFSAKTNSFIISYTPIKSQNPDTPLSIKRSAFLGPVESSSISNSKLAARRLRYEHTSTARSQSVARPYLTHHAPRTTKTISQLATAFSQKTPPFPRFQTYTQKFGNGVFRSEKKSALIGEICGQISVIFAPSAVKFPFPVYTPQNLQNRQQRRPNHADLPACLLVYLPIDTKCVAAPIIVLILKLEAGYRIHFNASTFLTFQRGRQSPSREIPAKSPLVSQYFKLHNF